MSKTNRHLEKYETIVIDYGRGKNRWIGSHKGFKTSNPTSEVHDIYPLEVYTKRIKELNGDK